MLITNNDCNKIECRKGIPVFCNNNSHISMYRHMILQSIHYNHQWPLISKQNIDGKIVYDVYG